MLFSNTGIVGSRSGANRSCPGAVVTNFDKHCHLLGTPQQCSFQPAIPASEDVSPCSREPLVLRAWKLFWYSPKPRPIGLITLEKQSFVFSGELRMEGLWFPYVSSLMLRNPVRVGFAQFFFFFTAWYILLLTNDSKMWFSHWSELVEKTQQNLVFILPPHLD